MVKTTKSSTVGIGKTVIAAPGEGRSAMSLDQSAENNVHAGEEVVADKSPTTPGTNADKATADARKKPKLKPQEFETSYAEIRRSLNRYLFANNNLQPLRLWPRHNRLRPRASHLLGTQISSTFAEVVSHRFRRDTLPSRRECSYGAYACPLPLHGHISST